MGVRHGAAVPYKLSARKALLAEEVTPNSCLDVGIAEMYLLALTFLVSATPR
jgi:hypothetical protein